ncbi:MAG: tyrosine-type recombinase/integrase [Anaerolineae bacterium]
MDHQHAQGLSPATVKRRAAALKAFFDFVAEELEQPDRPNPVSMKRHAGRQPRHLPRDLSDTEVERLLEVVENWRDLAMISLMLYAGLRVGEVITLCWADITIPDDPEAPLRLRVMGKRRKERIAYLYREG